MQKIKAEIVQKADHGFGSRVETAPLEIEYVGDDIDVTYETDWPGIFIRGDDALMHYLPALTYLLEHVNVEDDSIMDTMNINICKGLAHLLSECAVKPKEQSDAKDD